MPHKDPFDNARYLRDRRQKRKAAGLCIRCSNLARPGKTLCELHAKASHDYYTKDYAENAEKWCDRSKKRLLRLRQEVITHYGGRCACCGEMTIEFLTMDHVNGEAAVARRTARTAQAGAKLYWYLKREGFPEGYRVLCSNCNLAMSIHGQCPHGTLPPQMTNHPANPYRDQWKEKYDV